MSDYETFLEEIAPVYLSLDHTHASIDRAEYWIAHSERKIQREVMSKYVVSKTGEDFFDVVGQLQVDFRSVGAREGKPAFLKVHCTFIGHFHTKEPMNREFAERFAESSAWLMFWPYFRQFVSDTTSRMGIPPAMLPVAVSPGKMPSEKAGRLAGTSSSLRRRVKKQQAIKAKT